MTRIVELILTDFCRGRGTTEDVCRTVYQLWTKDGRLVAESDHGPSGGRIAGDAASFVVDDVVRGV